LPWRKHRKAEDMQGQPLSPRAQSAITQIETYLTAAQQEQPIPGLSAVIVHDQQIVWANGFGCTQLAAPIQARPQSIYRIGSVTKLFTATLLMILRDAGYVQLDDPLVKYVPEFRIPSRFVDAPPPTLRQLASHTAGLPVYAPIDYDLRHTAVYPPIEVVLASLSRTEQTFPPLTRLKYSNLGYALLGHALARAAAQPYHQAIANLILEPLGMAHSGFTSPIGSVETRAIGYERLSSDDTFSAAPEPHLGGFAPAGQMYSSVIDVAQFMMLQFHDGPAQGQYILRGTSLREMHAPVFMAPDWQSGIGLGWQLGRLESYTTLNHSGGIYGFTADVRLIPALKLGVGIFTNTWTSPWLMTSKILGWFIPVVHEADQHVRPHGTRLAGHDPRIYIGRYRNLGYADIDITFTNGDLVGRIWSGGQSLGEIHYSWEHDHCFRMRGGPAQGELARFELNADGNVMRMLVGDYPYVKLY
jgi:CubicO group peptidase (beta-lactamase class C family)